MISCLAPDVITGAAAQRAGLIRRAPVEDFTTYDDTELEAPIMGAPVPATEGFMQTGAWLRLGVAAVEDLCRYGRLPEPAKDPQFWRETSVLWIVPETTPDRFEWPEDEVLALLDEFCGRKLLAITQLPVAPPAFVPMGSAGTAAAVERALTGGQSIRRVLLLGTDSWLDPMSLGWLQAGNRLKADEQPAGLCPGEAAAALLLERGSEGQRRGATAEASLLASALVPSAQPPEDPAARVTRAPELGQALASAMMKALADAATPLPFRGDLYVDLNGETWRALAWGHAQPRLLQAIDFARTRVHLPAVQLGDVGAASAVVSLCLATRAFARGYAAADRALVCSISEHGHASAILIGAPPRAR
jgi:3-oxoacyl-[acyl-carrier-protein] synthase-1